MHALRWLWQPLTAFALAILVVLNLLLAWLWYLPALNAIDQTQQRLGESLARTLAFDIAAPLQRSDRLAISLLLNRTAEEPLVASASLSAADQNLTLNSRPVGPEPLDPVAFEHPVHFESTLLGQAEIQLDQRLLIQWRTRTQRSWFLFNLLALASAGGLIFWRSQIQDATTGKLARQLSEHLPGWRAQFSGPPEAQLKALVARLSNSLDSNSQVLRTLATASSDGEAERLLEQVHLAGEQGAYCDVALLHVQCHNWDAMTRHYDAHQLQSLWARYENLITQVGELYGGVLLPEGFTLVFGLGDDEHFAMHAVSAARVLQLAILQSQREHPALQPAFGFSLSAGPAFVSRTTKHGLPLPLVAGDAAQWLQQVSAQQPRGAIYLAEPMLQYQEVNQSIEVSLLRDITLSDGGRLEVWELDAIAGHRDRLLASQAHTLVERLR
ncbi:hypothetical protein ABMA57_09025 [Saccharospirillum sp. HFRX-1]|uniref:hypothetical protein n=1 Tax=unclassified Saccharospirillum TaxID=2633430 RepID=UPI0037129C5F